MQKTSHWTYGNLSQDLIDWNLLAVADRQLSHCNPKLHSQQGGEG